MTATTAMLLTAWLAPAVAQDIVPQSSRSATVDWSHRRTIIRDVDTMQEAGNKGPAALARWQARLQDPRFRMAVARKTVDVQTTANKAFSGQQLAYAGRTGKKQTPSSLTRDWAVPLGAATNAASGTGVGSTGIFPAKYTWDLNATPSCANDFLVYPTTTPGATAGTSATQIGTFVALSATTFANVSTGTGTLTITNGASSITLTATNTATATSNTGLNFYLGASANSNSPAYYAANLADAINRNGNSVGVTASAAGGVVTIIATTAGTAGNSITLTKSANLPDALLTLGGTSLGGGLATGVQPTLVAYNNLYKTTCTQSPTGLPNIFWSVNTGAGAIVETSPALSLDGTQVAFIQRTASASGPTASLVLLKWRSNASTVAPTLVSNSAYRSCSTASAPCMTQFALGANNQNSSPYVDYANDTLYVGDASGRLHKFTGVFGGTPAAAGGVWPVTVSAGNLLSSPVFDSASNQVFVGSDVSELGVTPASGGLLARVDAGTGTVVSTGQIGAFSTNAAGENVKLTGVRDGAIVDSMAQRVYAFLESDTTTTCGGVSSCKSVYQFPTNFAAGALGTATQIGRGQIPGRVMHIGQFDDAYWSSSPTSPTGSLYVCGSVDAGNSRAPTLWRVPITGNTMGTAVSVMSLTATPATGEVGATCSPLTLIKNGANEYLFAGVSANGNTTGCTGSCIYMVQLQGPSFDTTTTSGTLAGNVRYMSVSTSTALNATESSVSTTLSGPATFNSMQITQSAANPSNRTIVYRLRKNGANATMTCTTGNSVATCSTTGTDTFAAGDTITVSVDRSNTDTSVAMTIRVVLSFSPGTAPTTGLTAAGGTSGIVVDNISATAGASQVYYSTLARPGFAVQASQAGLQ